MHEAFRDLLLRTLPALLPALELLGVALLGRSLDLVCDSGDDPSVGSHELLRRNLGRLVICSKDARVGYVEHDWEADNVEQRHAHIGPLQRVDEGCDPSGVEVGGDQSRRLTLACVEGGSERAEGVGDLAQHAQALLPLRRHGVVLGHVMVDGCFEILIEGRCGRLVELGERGWSLRCGLRKLVAA